MSLYPMSLVLAREGDYGVPRPYPDGDHET
jgi:hypothetical protein